MGNMAGKLCVTPLERSRNKRKVLKNSTIFSEIEQHLHQLQQSWDYNELQPLFTCEICVESKPLGDSFNVENCTHFYCTRCTVKYIESRLKDNVLIITCPHPKCPGVLEPSSCMTILPHNVLIWWQRALCESVISEKVKFYCPFKDCSALLINEGDGRRGGKTRVIKYSVCPHCRRDICVQCKAPWHTGLSCAKFQRLKSNEDALMVDLANRENWRRCPKCKQYVEKQGGCNYITCRCQHGFCYNCGASQESHLHMCKTP